MRKTHEVLRLHFDLKLKQRQIARKCEPEPEYGTRISASVHGGWFDLAASGADVGAPDLEFGFWRKRN